MNTTFIHGGVTAPIGFKASGLACGIKKSGKKDLALIYSEVPAAAAGMFTTNKVQAAPVAVSKQHLRKGTARAIIANSGNANCMTGQRGMRDAHKMALLTARALYLKPTDVCVGSTGLIGKPLPMEKIEQGIPALVAALGKKSSDAAARGIMTTDHAVKEVAAEIRIAGKKVKLGAIAKGAGMIHPEMTLSSSAPSSAHAAGRVRQGPGGTRHATMLCFATTDAAIGVPVLRAALGRAVHDTFNMITIDGDMSTNDSVIVLANGKAGNKPIVLGSKEFSVFASALRNLFLALAQKMVRDAEGATKFVEVKVKGGRSAQEARAAARAIASSNLVKCALFGSDPNWGRIAAAAGQSIARFDYRKMQIWLGTHRVVHNGAPSGADQSAVNRAFARKNISISVELGGGTHSATAYTCDLSTDYVVLNSAYHT